LNVEDDDLSLINICFHHYCHFLKHYSRSCSRSCSSIFGIHDSKITKWWN